MTVAVGIDGDDLTGPPVAEPKPVVMPARRLAERQTVHHDIYFFGC
ncbi:hypothetical protein [Mesorhizobium sp. BHbdii]